MSWDFYMFGCRVVDALGQLMDCVVSLWAWTLLGSRQAGKRCRLLLTFLCSTALHAGFQRSYGGHQMKKTTLMFDYPTGPNLKNASGFRWERSTENAAKLNEGKRRPVEMPVAATSRGITERYV